MLRKGMSVFSKNIAPESHTCSKGITQFCINGRRGRFEKSWGMLFSGNRACSSDIFREEGYFYLRLDFLALEYPGYFYTMLCVMIITLLRRKAATDSNKTLYVYI